MSIHPEQQYLDLIKDITGQGFYRPSPHKPLPSQPAPPGTYSLINRNMAFDLGTGEFPLMTLRKAPFRAVAAELLWFLSGSTDNNDLKQLGANFWDPWDTPETNQSMGWPPGQLGPIYGKQWRHWGARMDRSGKFISPAGELWRFMGRFAGSRLPAEGYDQISALVKGLRETPNSKRLYVTAYDPIDMQDCFVTTCHGLFFCSVTDGRLNMHMIQRSGDVPVGIPFNIASYSLLLLMLAQVTELQPGVFHHTISDAHVYENQVPAMQTLLERKPLPYPTIRLNPDITSIFDFKLDDFEVVGYESWPHIAVPVAT